VERRHRDEGDPVETGRGLAAVDFGDGCHSGADAIGIPRRAL
jgi:hypothetical protein